MKPFSLLLTLVLVLRVLLGVSHGFAAEHEIAKEPVRIVTSSDPNIFPESWREPPVSASAEILPEQHFERVQMIVGRAAKKYPPQVLHHHLKVVFVLSELKYSGVVTSGTNSRTAVYVKVGDEQKGFTDAQIEGVFHAEFSSIFLRNRLRDFDAESWRQANPTDFEYLGKGVDAVKQKKAGLKLSEELHEQGFLKQYSQSTLENDFNAFAVLLFSGDPAQWNTAGKFPKLQPKLKLALDFYQKIDPSFTEDFFRSLANQ